MNRSDNTLVGLLAVNSSPSYPWTLMRSKYQHENQMVHNTFMPFDKDRLPDPLRESLDKLENVSTDICDFATQASEFRKSSSNENDTNLLLLNSWALLRQVETGVHIDDVGNDTREAISLLQKAKENQDFTDFLTPMQWEQFHGELSRSLKHAEDFEDFL